MSRQSVSAFTLLEVVVAMALLAMGLAATTAATFTTINTKDYTSERNLALMAMESKLEDILTNPFITAPAMGGDFEVTGLTVPETSAQSDVLRVSVTQVGGDPSVLQITLRCEWLHRGTPESLQLVFIHTNRGG